MQECPQGDRNLGGGEVGDVDRARRLLGPSVHRRLALQHRVLALACAHGRQTVPYGALDRCNLRKLAHDLVHLHRRGVRCAPERRTVRTLRRLPRDLLQPRLHGHPDRRVRCLGDGRAEDSVQLDPDTSRACPVGPHQSLRVHRVQQSRRRPRSHSLLPRLRHQKTACSSEASSTVAVAEVGALLQKQLGPGTRHLCGGP